jgi:hypothetical protein
MAADVATLRVYLSGSIPKGRNDPRPADHYWSDNDRNALRRALGSASVVLVDPTQAKICRQDSLANFGCDLYLVASSNVVLVDARTAKGIGVGAEMMFAVSRGIPVISWVPRETHYRRKTVEDVFGEDLSDWLHPFINGLSDYVVDSLEEAAALLGTAARSGQLAPTKNPESAIRHFRSQPEAAQLVID